MSTTPAVSICCITYNHEKYIRDALEGFLMQKTNFPIEILIHDDASTDHTADIIREYEAKHPDIIKPIYQTVNQYSQGKDVSSFNFDRARGKYIALCEGDDFWTDPRKLQIQYDFMESHPDYSMCFHNANIIAELGKSKILKRFAEINNQEYTADEIFDHWIIPTASAFFQAKFCKFIPINKDFWCGDIIIWLTVARYGKIFGFEKVMSVYRQTVSGAMGTMLAKTAVAQYDIYKKHLLAIKKEFSDIISPQNIQKQQNLLNFTHLVDLLKLSLSDAYLFFIHRSWNEKIDIVKRSFKLFCSILKQKKKY